MSMLPEEAKKFLEEIKKIPPLELKIKLLSGIYGDNESYDKYRLIKNYIQEKELEDSRNLTIEGLNIAKNNAKATKRLVWATWGLVIVTALLVLAAFIKK